MINKKAWKEFRDSGLLMIINQFLHVFGWSIVMEIENEEPINVYPARVKFRGFSEEAQSRNYKNVTLYMKEHAEELFKEVVEEE